MRRNSVLEVRPLAGALGAEVDGIDLSRPLDDETYADLRAVFVRHQVIFFRDQNLTPDSQKALTSRFGPIVKVPYVKGMDDHPEIIAVLKEPDERRISTFGGTWHSDFSFLEEPPLGTLLYALEVPPFGGDTLWASQYAAYETLSDGMRQMIDPLIAIHSGTPHGTTYTPPKDARLSKSVQMVRGDPSADVEVEHPVVRLHPESGRKALFVNPVYTVRFKDMTREESKPLLDFLCTHAVRPEFTCRFRWDKGSLAMWDNRCTLHLAINDYDGQRRLLHRTTIAGERPRGADA